jgi:hypothetical protein
MRPQSSSLSSTAQISVPNRIWWSAAEGRRSVNRTIQERRSRSKVLRSLLGKRRRRWARYVEMRTELPDLRVKVQHRRLGEARAGQAVAAVVEAVGAAEQPLQRQAVLRGRMEPMERPMTVLRRWASEAAVEAGKP